MSRPRDRASAAGLLPRMEARPWSNGKTVTYRYHPVGGKPINLGTDREQALRKVLDMNGEVSEMSNGPDDVILWPDDTWCYRHELAEFNHKSDDYEVLAVGTPAYEAHQGREAPRP